MAVTVMAVLVSWLAAVSITLQWKYGGDCDGSFSELTRCCIYYSTMINMAVTVMAVLVSWLTAVSITLQW